MVLLDCDFDTPDRYFKYSKEIYLVQSMDILTIQPLTLFLRKLSDKGAFSEEKARVVLNKYIKTKELKIFWKNQKNIKNRKSQGEQRQIAQITLDFFIEVL